MFTAAELNPRSALRERKPDALALGAILLALAVAAPILAVVWLAFAPGPAGGSDSIAHLVGTVLPRYTLVTAHLALVVVLVVLALGVSTGWLVSAYDFPGRSWLAWLLVLPLSTPAFVLAYAYTDFLASWGPLQSGLRTLAAMPGGSAWFAPLALSRSWSSPLTPRTSPMPSLKPSATRRRPSSAFARGRRTSPI